MCTFVIMYVHFGNDVKWWCIKSRHNNHRLQTTPFLVIYTYLFYSLWKIMCEDWNTFLLNWKNVSWIEQCCYCGLKRLKIVFPDGNKAQTKKYINIRWIITKTTNKSWVEWTSIIWFIDWNMKLWYFWYIFSWFTEIIKENHFRRSKILLLQWKETYFFLL